MLDGPVMPEMTKNWLWEGNGCVLIIDTAIGAGGRNPGVLPVYPYTFFQGHMGENQAFKGTAGNWSCSVTMKVTHLF